MTKTKRIMDHRKMLIDIDKLVNNDWSLDINCKLSGVSRLQKEWTQQEANEMAQVLEEVYKISHGYDGCCNEKYILNKTK